jgi:hypothetical protein
VCHIIHTHRKSSIEKNRSWLTWLHVRVLFAIEHCCTTALGGHGHRNSLLLPFALRPGL